MTKITVTGSNDYFQLDLPLVSAVLGQMAHLVASITLNSTRSGNIGFDSLLPSVLLWLVIIIVVVGVGVTVVVVAVIVVVESSSVVKLFVYEALILAPECA
ncbi:hypothetical protein Tco_0205278 [Tanacetum coccineum]